MEVACEIEMIKDPETRKSNITYVARHIEDALTTQREYRSGCMVRCKQFLARSCCLWFGKRYGNYLICLYLIIKSLYIFNVVGQFFFMNRILGTNYTFYGIDLLRDIADGYVWQESGNFPRITLCDFEVRKLANVHRHTVQCVLPINMFNEKIFIFLWFWFILVSAVNISSFLYWSYKSSFHGNRVHFIRKFLKLHDALEPGDKKRTLTFVDTYLRQDGVFILRLVAQNAGELVASEIVARLWNLYRSCQTVTTVRVGGSGTVISGTPDEKDKSGLRRAFSPQRFLPSSRSNHHHHHTRHYPSPSPSGNQASSRSSLPSSHGQGLDLTRKQAPPPIYSAHVEKTPTSLSPPPLPPSIRDTVPPPLPPPPASSNGGFANRRSSSSQSRSQTSTMTDSDTGPSVRLHPTNTSETLRPTMIDKKRTNGSGSSRGVISTTTTTTAKVESGIVKRDPNSQENHDEDPGEFV